MYPISFKIRVFYITVFRTWVINYWSALLSSLSSEPAFTVSSEHWLQRDHFILINIDQYKLADSYCRNTDKHGGSCIFVSNELKTRELTFLKNLGREKVFEISAIELVDF
jgi:hypothetical protein